MKNRQSIQSEDGLIQSEDGLCGSFFLACDSVMVTED